jgi:hypothetical protein
MELRSSTDGWWTCILPLLAWSVYLMLMWVGAVQTDTALWWRLGSLTVLADDIVSTRLCCGRYLVGCLVDAHPGESILQVMLKVMSVLVGVNYPKILLAQYSCYHRRALLKPCLMLFKKLPVWDLQGDHTTSQSIDFCVRWWIKKTS